MSTNISKHISFPEPLINKITRNASIYGISFAEYIRHLAINAESAEIQKEELRRKKWSKDLPVYFATDAESQSIEVGRRELKNTATKTMSIDEVMNKIS